MYSYSAERFRNKDKSTVVTKEVKRKRSLKNGVEEGEKNYILEGTFILLSAFIGDFMPLRHKINVTVIHELLSVQ